MEYKHILNLALCVCAQDGVISETELKVLFKKLNEITRVSKKDFDIEVNRRLNSKTKNKSKVNKM